MTTDDPLSTSHFVIGIGGNMKCGKTTAADFIAVTLNQHMPERNGYHVANRISFATKLKEVATLMGWDGQKDPRGRFLLQHLGTEVGRAYDADMWVKHVAATARQWYQGILVIDDCRFPKEVDWCNKYGTTIRVARSVDREYGADHASETLMDTCQWHHTILNNGPLELFQAALALRMTTVIQAHPEPFSSLRANNPFSAERTQLQ